MTEMTGRRVDRRRLLQGAAALGISIPALSGAFAIPGRAYFASAQDANDGILTISQEQQQTWVRNFNPFLPESQGSRWPTNAGIHEPMIIYNTATARNRALARDRVGVQRRQHRPHLYAPGRRNLVGWRAIHRGRCRVHLQSDQRHPWPHLPFRHHGGVRRRWLSRNRSKRLITRPSPSPSHGSTHRRSTTSVSSRSCRSTSGRMSPIPSPKRTRIRSAPDHSRM